MRSRSIFFLMAVFCWPFQAFAQPGINYDSFKSIPVMDQGRLKPLDTYARNLLIQFSGRDSYEGQPAIVWFAHLLFDPDTVKTDKVFLINDPDIATALNIAADPHRRYAADDLIKTYNKLSEIEVAAQKIPEKERSIVENEIIRVFNNINLYADLSRSMFFAFPQKDFTITSRVIKSRLGFPSEQDQFSFIDIALNADKVQEIAKDLARSPSQISSGDIELMKAVKNLFIWSDTYKGMPLTMIPTGREWMSPWDAIAAGLGGGRARQLISIWRDMALGFKQHNAAEFNEAAQMYRGIIPHYLEKGELGSFHKFPLELIYNACQPFLWAKILYIFAFIFFVISFISSNRFWYACALVSVTFGFVPHILGLMARIIIMGRPPVSNLYETFIFVGFIAVLLGLIIEYVNRQWLGIVTAAISGTALLFIAGKYSAEGDTLKMLVAVLNSNFWLATHVTTITMGYGATCVAGVLGHIWLLQAAAGKKDILLEKTYKTVLGILGLALPLTFLGTNLGGIWADQSWGRFWGWDPKENGALMIVIWTTMILHARISNLIDAQGLAIGAVLGMMVVMWAWFGVNLLSIGLHSYGFTSGIAAALGIYVSCEILFLAVTTFMIRQRRCLWKT